MKSVKSLRSAGLSSALMASSLGLTPCVTSAASTAEPQSSVGNATLALEEVIVTAQRREEKLSRVPISVTAMSQKALDDLRVEDVEDLASGIVPGLMFPSRGPFLPGEAEIAIRGIFAGANAPTTGIYIDETPISTQNGPAGNFLPRIFDLQRVEVLRGPQGTLFGSGAEGGAIRFITPEPSLSEYGGYGKAEWSFTDGGAPSYQAGIAYGGPIVDDRVGFRMSGWYSKEGGYVDRVDRLTGATLDEDINSNESYVLRPAVKFALTDHLQVTAAAFIEHDEHDAQSSYWLESALPGIFDPDDKQTGTTTPTSGSQDLLIPSLAIEYDFDRFTLRSDTSYLSAEVESLNDYTYFGQATISRIFTGGGNAQTFIPGLAPIQIVSNFSSQTKVWQQELRAVSKDKGGRWNWTFGLFYRDAPQDNDQFVTGNLAVFTEYYFGPGVPVAAIFGVPQPSEDINFISRGSTRHTQKAAFGEVTYEVLDGLKLTAGVRVERSTLERTTFQTGPFAGVLNQTTVAPAHSETPVTPRVAISYQVNDDNLVYTSAAKGYRQGGANTLFGNALCGPSLESLGLTAVPPGFDSDSVWSYEIGTKNSLLDNTLQIQASAFHIDWTDIQRNIYLPSCLQGFNTNLGEAVSRGFDLQVAAVLTAGLRVGATAAYTDAYVKENVYGATLPDGTPVILAYKDDKLPQVIPWMFSVNTEYHHGLDALWSGSEAYFRADYRWLDQTPGGNANLANHDALLTSVRPDARSYLNLRAGVRTDKLDISVFVNNVTRTDEMLGTTYLGGAGLPEMYTAGDRPLTGGLSVNYKFE